MENDLTKKVVQDFIVDGRLQVVAKEQADAELTGTVQRYDRLVLTRSADSTQVPQQYKLQVAVDIDFTDLPHRQAAVDHPRPGQPDPRHGAGPQPI